MARKFNTSQYHVEEYAGELGSSETKTETAGYMSVSQQLTRLAKAGWTKRQQQEMGHDLVSKNDEELFISGMFDEPAYDAVSVAEGMAELRARRDTLLANEAAAEAAAAAAEGAAEAVPVVEEPAPEAP